MGRKTTAGRGDRLIGSMAVEATSPAEGVPMFTSTRIAGRLVFLVGATVCLGVRGWHAAPAAAAATTALESTALRLEVTAAPYSYAVIEKSTGQVLLRQAQTTFSVGTARAASTGGRRQEVGDDARGHASDPGILRQRSRPVDLRQPGRRAGAIELRQGDEHHRSVSSIRASTTTVCGSTPTTAPAARSTTAARTTSRCSDSPARQSAAATPAAARRFTSRHGSMASTRTHWPSAAPPSP